MLNIVKCLKRAIVISFVVQYWKKVKVTQVFFHLFFLATKKSVKTTQPTLISDDKSTVHRAILETKLICNSLYMSP